ncbi:hypothetical protein TPHA_0C00340 [Tetrapisispora phaffii CBS 4417]|uniref:RING-type E3 ubiquitin transferase n=1 Tax=Tetrapisispora phaffii (strain ATCC 24235 / CBS 4417 / NBRC 1672 / NRRL Y-8282 / UCD 70-5) TaxID=1071381 RepID=G8BR15_TETPH|nr:hypothetical protein TPHA_0C00340 [Tetrapisispora phaffii CBS 4417]CCE62191.1 hypothetical protein TPHA_0C00340 [Tetrapisispora phaffii CBS 4417]
MSSIESGIEASNSSNLQNKSSGKQNRRKNFRKLQGPQTRAGTISETSKTSLGNHNEEDDSELCLICAEPLEFISLSSCHHKTCYKCSFRQRALYDKKSCLICRTDNDVMKFTDNLDKKYEDLDKCFKINEKYGVAFENEKTHDITMNLLKFSCQLCDKDDSGSSTPSVDYGSYKKLNDHLRNIHKKYFCMICAKNNHSFPSELPIYTQNQLKNHQVRGDNKANNSGFVGHPLCAFCKDKRFYSDDELYAHMRNNHERCHICDKLKPNEPQYFKDYNQLFQHFKNSHYICTIQSCLDNKFVVFGDELELQAHILQEHGDIVKGKPKLFQSELSTFIATPARVIRDQRVFDDDLTGQSNSLRNMPDESPELSRARLEERAKHYLGNDLSKFATFTNINEKYEKKKINSNDVLTSYTSLFTEKEADVYLLINNLASTFPKNSTKYKELNAIYDAHEQKLARDSLPSLSSDPSLHTVGSAIWRGSSGATVSSGGSRNLNTSSLPTLQLRPASFDVFGQQNKQVKSYKTLTKPSKTSRPVVRSAAQTSAAQSEYKPTYLNKNIPDQQSSQQSLSSLTSSKSNVSLTSNRVVLGKGKSKLAAMSLESLPTPKPRVHIPPVREIKLPDSKNWGKSNGRSNDIPDDDLSNLMIDNSNNKGKKKGKQKQLLFHIGI